MNNARPKLPIIRTMIGTLTSSGLHVSVKEHEDQSQEFIYFPSITYANRSVDRTRVNTLSYGTHDIIQLLIRGGVPPFIFQKEYWHAKQQEHFEDTHFTYRPKFRRKRELWEPKIHGKTLNTKIDQEILEARLKQKRLLKKISARAEEARVRGEEVWRRRVEKIDERVKAFLEKMEKRAKQKCARNRRGQHSKFKGDTT